MNRNQTYIAYEMASGMVDGSFPPIEYVAPSIQSVEAKIAKRLETWRAAK